MTEAELQSRPVRLDREGRVAIITLDRRDQRNAINREMVHALNAATTSLKDDDDVRAVVITGAGQHFSAGADITVASQMRDESSAREWISFVRDAFARVAGLKQPVVAAMEGWAAGGGLELGLWCDIRIVASDAQLAVPEVKIGAMPAAGGTQLLPRLIGTSAAFSLLLTGKPIDGQRAYQLGLAAQAVPPGQALGSAIALADELATRAPLALAAIKSAASALWLPLDEALEVERRLGAELFASRDREEGMQAFLEKREANFRGE